MEIAKIILGFIEALIWPIVVILIIYRFSEELKALFAKALRSHEVEVDILGQKIKLKALEKLSEKTTDVQKEIESEIKPNQNALLSMHFINIISKLSSDEAFILREIAREITDEGYVGCEAERLVLEKFVEQKILFRDDRGFYHPTDIGKRLLMAIRDL